MHALSPESSRTSTDTGAVARAGLKSVMHDQWFRAQVQHALMEADHPHAEWVTHDVVKQDMQRQRESLQQCAAVATRLNQTY